MIPSQARIVRILRNRINQSLFEFGAELGTMSADRIWEHRDELKALRAQIENKRAVMTHEQRKGATR